jgi:hypothetical protein
MGRLILHKALAVLVEIDVTLAAFLEIAQRTDVAQHGDREQSRRPQWR